MSQTEPRPLALCHSKVELRMSCTNLLDKDYFSKSDPMCVLFMFVKKKWVELDRSEMILNNLNPEFAKTFTVDYYFEQVQKLKFEVYDIDSGEKNLEAHDFLGELRCTLGRIVSHGVLDEPLVMRNKKPAGKGRIKVSAIELKGGNEVAICSFRATDLDNKKTFSLDLFGKSGPYLEIHREGMDDKWLMVHRTEVVKNTLHPTWKPVKIAVQTLCGGNHDLQLLIKCNLWNNNGSSQFIGEFQTSYRSFVLAPSKWDCRIRGNKSGIIHLDNCKVETDYTFLDYFLGGCQIDFTVAIDFTGSNGDPKSPQSLHYMDPYHPNEYLSALRSVGEVCQDYDTDRRFPAFGFGAKVPPNYQVSFEFPLNFNYQDPYCNGISGIEEAYRTCLPQIQLYGPTNFAPIINRVARFAQEEAQKGTASNYFVLLILTDGVISDFRETRDAIVAASDLPMSIIIVGVGDADFTDMNVLDGDDDKLTDHSGRACKRDIVQFVPYRKFKDAPDELAKEVLEEFPGQVVSYFCSKNLHPITKSTFPRQSPFASANAPPTHSAGHG